MELCSLLLPAQLLGALRNPISDVISWWNGAGVLGRLIGGADAWRIQDLACVDRHLRTHVPVSRTWYNAADKGLCAHTNIVQNNPILQLNECYMVLHRLMKRMYVFYRSKTRSHNVFVFLSRAKINTSRPAYIQFIFTR
jgi:hypothetical protein